MTNQEVKPSSIRSGKKGATNGNQPPMAAELHPLIVITSGKGGVGKTISAQAAMLTLAAHGHNVVGIDADASNASLKRQVPSSLLLGGSTGVEMKSNLELLFISQCVNERKSLVVDTGGGFEQPIRDWFASEDVVNILKRDGVRVINLVVIDSSLDSATHVLESVDSMTGTTTVIVKNLGHVPGEIGDRAFQKLFANEEFESYANLATVVTMPRLQDEGEINAMGARLHSISDEDSPARVNPFLVSRTETWISKVTSKMAEAFAID